MNKKLCLNKQTIILVVNFKWDPIYFYEYKSKWDTTKIVNVMTKSFTRNELILKYLHLYFKKKERGKGGGILVISECQDHVFELQKNFNDEICTFIVGNQFKKKEIVYELKQKKELVFSTYADLRNPLFSNLLGFISVIFFLTPSSPKNGMDIIKNIISCKDDDDKGRFVVMDLVDNFEYTKQQFLNRKRNYQEYKDIQINNLNAKK